MKRDSGDNRKLKRKIVLLVCASILLIAAIVFRQCDYKKEKEQYEEYQKKEKIKQPNDGTETESNISEEKLKADEIQTEETAMVHISNLEEYATDLLGKNTDLLEQKLREWIEEKQMDVAAAEIFHVMIPEEAPECIDFYLRMDNGTLLLLSYHTDEKKVTAHVCNYTEEEIKSEIWEENGPDQRDVTAEDEEVFMKEQEEEDGTEGEN